MSKDEVVGSIAFPKKPEKLPETEIKGEVDNETDYVVIQFNNLDTCRAFRGKVGLPGGTRILEYEKMVEALGLE